MKNLIRTLIPILLLSFTLSDDLDLGLGFQYNGNDHFFISFIGQIHNYKSDNFYHSYTIVLSDKLSLCFNGCNTRKGLGLSTSYGKYYRKKFSQLSYGVGIGMNYFPYQNRLGFYFPFEREITIIVKNKIGLSFGGMVYPFFNQPGNNESGVYGLGFGLDLNLKILGFRK